MMNRVGIGDRSPLDPDTEDLRRAYERGRMDGRAERHVDADLADTDRAYERGRLEERADHRAEPDVDSLTRAYDRGRQDERASRRRHPVFMTLMMVAAAVGLVVLGAAAWQGSFARGGRVVDGQIASAADRAEPAVRGVAADAGQALSQVGQSLEDKSKDTQ